MTNSEAKMLEPGGLPIVGSADLWLPKAATETWCRIARRWSPQFGAGTEDSRHERR